MGKPVSNSGRSYGELRAITDAVYSGELEKSDAFREAYTMLDKYDVKLRDKDGMAPVMTLSPPDDNTIVMGIRYVKKDGCTTEDHFIFRRDMDLYRCKGREIDKILPKYQGTHELQISR